VQAVKRLRKAFLTIAIVVLLWVQKSPACSRVFTTFKVRQDFSVFVKGRDGRALEGISVKIVFAIPTYDLVAEELTSKEGMAFFHGFMVSDYWISAGRAGVSGTVAKLWPVNDASGETVITLTWPMGPISKVRTFAGHLLDKQQFAPAGADVRLTDTLSAKELERTATDERGKFAFQSVVPGLYLLHVEPPEDCSRGLCGINGNILVELDSAAKDLELPRYSLFMSSCGLGAYKDDGSVLLFQ